MMDKSQLAAFCDYAVGGRPIGGTTEEPLETPYSPELRAFVVAMLGDNTPANGWQITYPRAGAAWAVKTRAFAALLREVADGIDPPTATEIAP